jgi:hypothetical protein
MNANKRKETIAKTLKLGLIAGILFSSLGIRNKPTLAAYVPGSFPSTCSKTTYSKGWNGKAYLSSRCKVSSGFFSNWTSKLELRGIHNINGQLAQNPLTGSSSFQKSCRNVSVRGNQLTASCPTSKRTWGFWHKRSTSTIALAEITNSNGRLHYEDNQIINRAADAIVAHAYDKHGKEYGKITKDQFKKIIVEIIKNPTASKTVDRITDKQKDTVQAYWSNKHKTIVIVQSDRLLSRSTAFKPRRGKAYYDNFK